MQHSAHIGYVMTVVIAVVAFAIILTPDRTPEAHAGAGDMVGAAVWHCQHIGNQDEPLDGHGPHDHEVMATVADGHRGNRHTTSTCQINRPCDALTGGDGVHAPDLCGPT